MRNQSDVKVAVIGLGYIGLPTAALLAERGYRVFGMDVCPEVVSTISQGKVHIVEPDLAGVVSKVVTQGALSVDLTLHESEIYIICVPTPFNSINGDPSPNLDYIEDAARSIAALLKAGDTVILESTSPVGTTEQVAQIFDGCGVDINQINIAYCPERVLPGNVMRELIENDRVVGGINEDSAEAAAAFYQTFVTGEVLVTDARSAEMCKLTENSFRDLNIAFANELSIICDANGVDVWELIRLANHHPRVNILRPGTGVGGHCIAVDPWFIVSSNPDRSDLIRQARITNDEKPFWVVDKIREHAAEGGRASPKIACLGLSFKPDIDDLRESPAVKVVQSLMRFGLQVLCVEPNIEQHDDYSIVSLESALDDADLIAILVAHKEFRAPAVTERLTEMGALDFCGALA